MHHCYTRMCLVGPNELCTDMFQGNDASSRWTATQQTRRKADPIVWMCSVQQQVKEWKSFCNNGTFVKDTAQGYASSLSNYTVPGHASSLSNYTVQVHALSLSHYSAPGHPSSLSNYTAQGHASSLSNYTVQGHASSLSNYITQSHALSLSKYTITGHILVVSESDQGYYFTHQTPTHPPIHPKYHLST